MAGRLEATDGDDQVPMCMTEPVHTKPEQVNGMQPGEYPQEPLVPKKKDDNICCLFCGFLEQIVEKIVTDLWTILYCRAMN